MKFLIWEWEKKFKSQRLRRASPHPSSRVMGIRYSSRQIPFFFPCMTSQHNPSFATLRHPKLNSEREREREREEEESDRLWWTLHRKALLPPSRDSNFNSGRMGGKFLGQFNWFLHLLFRKIIMSKWKLGKRRGFPFSPLCLLSLWKDLSHRKWNSIYDFAKFTKSVDAGVGSNRSRVRKIEKVFCLL